MAEQDYVAKGAFRADGVNYTRGQEVPLDSISNNHLLKETGVVVLSNSDEGQAAIADYERLQTEDAQAAEERELEATLGPTNSSPITEHTEEELEAIRSQARDEPYRPSQEGAPSLQMGAVDDDRPENEMPVRPEQVPQDEPEDVGATDDRGDDPRAYPASSERGGEMVDPGGAQPPENASRSRFHQHSELGASSEELAQKDAEQEEARLQAQEAQGEQASSQEDARQNEGLAANEPTPEEREQGLRAGSSGAGDVNATDGAKKLAEEEGVDLSQVEGSGEDGRINKSDVEEHLKSQE